MVFQKIILLALPAQCSFIWWVYDFSTMLSPWRVIECWSILWYILKDREPKYWWNVDFGIFSFRASGLQSWIFLCATSYSSVLVVINELSSVSSSTLLVLQCWYYLKSIEDVEMNWRVSLYCYTSSCLKGFLAKRFIFRFLDGSSHSGHEKYACLL